MHCCVGLRPRTAKRQKAGLILGLPFTYWGQRHGKTRHVSRPVAAFASDRASGRNLARVLFLSGGSGDLAIAIHP
jgi:hypothetical protein